MATHNVDKKILARLARQTIESNHLLSSALYQILGLSEMLSHRLLRARQLRKNNAKDDRATTLYHHVIWLSREGLAIVELILPQADNGQYGIEMRVFCHKLRASFYHVFVLFHNNPTVFPAPVNMTSPKSKSPPTPKVSPLSPTSGNGKGKRPAPPPKDSPPSKRRGSQTEQARSNQRNQPNLRDPVISMLSEESAVTNPWAISPPPGFANRESVHIGDPSAFLLPSANFIPITTATFSMTNEMARTQLPGSAPLRLSVALEFCAFKWDCLHDQSGCRKLASTTIRDVYQAQEGMDDNEFDDAASLVNTLGRMMRRKSSEGTPKISSTPVSAAPSEAYSPTSPAATATPVPPVPPVPKILAQPRMASPSAGRSISRKPVASASNGNAKQSASPGSSSKSPPRRRSPLTSQTTVVEASNAAPSSNGKSTSPKQKQSPSRAEKRAKPRSAIPIPKRSSSKSPRVN